MKYLFLISCLLGLAAPSLSQQKQPPIHHSLNRISCGNLDPFFSKLQSLEKGRSKRVSIVQIGDSHTQPDFISSVLRKEMQKKFGNAGRGLVFPYAMALSNSPQDIKSHSNIPWQYNRLAHPELGANSGVSGFIIYSRDSSGKINISLKDPAVFDSSCIGLFMDKSTATRCHIYFNNDTIGSRITDSSHVHAGPLEKISIDFSNNDSTFSFYGLTMENNKGGLLYHNIGVNGARYDQYNITPGFWKDLPSLKADLYIVSLGTNEAQKDSFNREAFQQQLSMFVENLRVASPGASVLITTAMDSYKKQKPNHILKQINDALADYCSKEKIALWDLYRITNGLGSSRHWLKAGLMNKDRIHFLKEGYELQGKLLLSAIMNAYAGYKEQEGQN